ncbi:DUF5994 family protein [Mycolicibacterium sp. ND9-15]|uniref:DUF5994 family protein n=1 Tax=Mycolicibacterium sp. ND9-15 TaxID=3042320 RepID=UPI002DDB8794|nr:DUF5994 family protein [Mycolicibacterium sp. ND9-15]WSE57822.1 DUF5994 family protein [Mycolicibacterium sp. ND9-15]
MNGLTGARRLARPVRLVLARSLGSDIDGAWWPHTGSVAGELPELIETLHKTLGEIVDIRVNWAATEGALDYNSILRDSRARKAGPRRPHRLMIVVGRSASAKLLVVPHLTTPALGAMVLRCAVGRSNHGDPQGGQWSQAADTVIRDARADSLAWAT